MSEINVGANRPVRRLADAVTVAQDGDVILVDPGRYVNDFPVITKTLTIKGMGGGAELVATGSIPNGKGILVAKGKVVVEDLTFRGAMVPDNNGAGIRYEGGTLTVRHCRFEANQNGILAGADPDGRIDISTSTFHDNGAGDGYSHAIYVGRVKSFSITDSDLSGTRVGHHVKSRAESSLVSGNRIDDGPGGTASYAVDLPNGGAALVVDNTIQQSATSHNPAIIHFGGEGPAYPGSSLLVKGNVIVNHHPSGIGVLNQTEVTAVMEDNHLQNLPIPFKGKVEVRGEVLLDQSPSPGKTSAHTLCPWDGDMALCHTIALLQF